MSHRGRLLVATPLIEDPNFLRTVVVLLEHDEEGALGVVLNRPSLTTVAEPLPEWAGLAAAPAVMFMGGPVATDAVIGLATAPAGAGPLPGFDRVGRTDVGTVDLHAGPDIGSDWSGLRLFVGAAGWSSAQLEAEIVEGAWWVVDACGDDIVTTDPDGLWERAVRRQGGSLGWFANCPLDPSAN